MTSKLGFILLVVVFGALMFLAGAIAPASIRKPLDAFGQKTMARFADTGASQAANANAHDPVSASNPALASAADHAPSGKAKEEPVWAESLLIPTPLPEKAQYALQAGQFASAEEANALGVRIKALHLPFVKVFDVVDQAGVRSTVVPVGPYASPDAARAARGSIARELGLAGPLALILLPAAPAAASVAISTPVL